MRALRADLAACAAAEMTSSMGTVYDNDKDKDGWLCITYSTDEAWTLVRLLKTIVDELYDATTPSLNTPGRHTL